MCVRERDSCPAQCSRLSLCHTPYRPSVSSHTWYACISSPSLVTAPKLYVRYKLYTFRLAWHASLHLPHPPFRTAPFPQNLTPKLFPFLTLHITLLAKQTDHVPHLSFPCPYSPVVTFFRTVPFTFPHLHTFVMSHRFSDDSISRVDVTSGLPARMYLSGVWSECTTCDIVSRLARDPSFVLCNRLWNWTLS